MYKLAFIGLGVMGFPMAGHFRAGLLSSAPCYRVSPVDVGNVPLTEEDVPVVGTPVVPDKGLRSYLRENIFERHQKIWRVLENIREIVEAARPRLCPSI